jgi:hypothetical protein
MFPSTPREAFSVALFERYVGVDYSGAQTPESSLFGLRVYVVESAKLPEEVRPRSGPRKHWTRNGVARWLCEELSKGTQTLVGIDHGFSFPIAYFEKYSLPLDWAQFLDDFSAALADRQPRYVCGFRS